MHRDALPSLVESRLPAYVHANAAEVFDPITVTLGSTITDFSFLPDTITPAIPNTTVVAQPSEFQAFGLPQNGHSILYVATAALTAIGFDREQTYGAHETDTEETHPWLDKMYGQLNMQHFSHNDPSTWANALGLVASSYATGLLRVKDHLVLPVRSASQRSELKARALNVRRCVASRNPENAYEDMETLGSLFNIPPMATYGLAKVLSIVSAPSPRQNYPKPGEHVRRLVEIIQENGVSQINGSLGAIINTELDGKISGLAADTIIMAGLGLSPSDMTLASKRYVEQGVAPSHVCKRALKLLELPSMLNSTSALTELVRSGYTRITPSEQAQENAPELPDEPLHQAILSLLPSGMNERMTINLIRQNVPGHEAIDEKTLRAAMRELFNVTGTTNKRSLNFYLFAHGITDKHDLHDVDTSNPEGNTARLQRKLGDKVRK